jgi:hypothetical protein
MTGLKDLYANPPRVLCLTKPGNLRPNVISLTWGFGRSGYQCRSPHALKRHGYQRKFFLTGRGIFAMRSFLHLFFIAVLIMAALVPAKPTLAQKLVDPNVVAPEFRAAAEKRRAEQVKMMRCQRKAEEAKVLPRDRTAHINQCLQAETGK